MIYGNVIGGSAGSDAGAYIVSSIDELPPEAREGSLAIVNEQVAYDGVGTWLLWEELSTLSLVESKWAHNSYCSPFEISFSSNGIKYTNFRVSTQGSSSWGIYALFYESQNAGGVDNTYLSHTAYCHNPGGSYGITHGWYNTNFRTIEVSFADNEAKEWLMSHANQIVQGEPVIKIYPKLYAKQDGEWVPASGIHIDQDSYEAGYDAGYAAFVEQTDVPYIIQGQNLPVDASIYVNGDVMYYRELFDIPIGNSAYHWNDDIDYEVVASSDKFDITFINNTSRYVCVYVEIECQFDNQGPSSQTFYQRCSLDPYEEYTWRVSVELGLGHMWDYQIRGLRFV